MLGVDRLDMVKGIPQKLLAYEKFLEEHPEWRDKVGRVVGGGRGEKGFWGFRGFWGVGFAGSDALPGSAQLSPLCIVQTVL